MNLSTSTFHIPAWLQATHLQGMLRGIERESLRMQENGFLSQQPHPQVLGSALTHSCITTDYSEALMEFITPPQKTIHDALNYLKNIHVFVNKNLPQGETLWAMSMPCMLDDKDENIPLAQYGSSNIGQFKTLYRHGLGIRYGRRMQTISGVHYNLSFPESLFSYLQQYETDERLKQLSLQDYRSERYFALIRNFIRMIPMVMYLLGASPTVCRCFVTGRKHHLQELNAKTLYLPYATALRMGNLGYQNSAQRQLGIHYNDLKGYLQGLRKAIYTPFEAFKKLGLDDEHGTPIQINDHVLQIENEYYSLIRPKQPPKDDETPAQALENRGVSYVELRAVDVNPFSPIGITTDNAGFLEILALYCLLLESPSISEQEQDLIEKNQANTVNAGRDDATKIEFLQQGEVKTLPLRTWIAQHLQNMKTLATLLDECNQDTIYTTAWQLMNVRCEDVNQTLSAQVLAQTGESMASLGRELSKQHQQILAKSVLSDDVNAFFQHETQVSLQKQTDLEQQQEISFKEYLKPYRNLA